MPKVKNLNLKLKKIVKEFGENVLMTDGNIIFCKLCEIKINSDKKYNVQQHIGKEKHKEALKKLEAAKHNAVQPFIQQFCKSDFNADLCSTLVAANIPLNKLNNEHFRSFLSKYCNKTIPNESTLRKGYFDSCYTNTIAKIRDAVNGQKIWVCIDETIDSVRRNVANVIIGILKPQDVGKTYLIHTEYLEKVSHSTIFKLFDKSMHILWPNNVNHEDILLFVSDAAPYMKKAGRCIQTLYPKALHVTCLTHALYNVCEEVRAHFPKVDRLIAEMKKTFLKSVEYYYTYLNEIKSAVEEFSENAQCVNVVKELIKDQSLHSNLVYITTNFGFIPHAITQLEKRGETLAKSISMVLEAKQKLEEANGEVAKLILEKCNRIFSKNNGWTELQKVNSIHNGSVLNVNVEPYDSNDLVYMKYAPITSVDVERSFSMYKNILAPNRMSFNENNLTKYMVVNSFFNI
ncbi:hypothetical protein AGLY_011884 [Aphis glycines]|uniref:DUF659 domain-containing protein n=1 Tax=Aphis glycines TaxID=307491 RepID=A0A6G0TCE2_APHGL|nr:hypothetical protein AGLY_011884 [Aphis glycines]